MELTVSEYMDSCILQSSIARTISGFLQTKSRMQRMDLRFCIRLFSVHECVQYPTINKFFENKKSDVIDKCLPIVTSV